MTNYSYVREILPFITTLMKTWMYCINILACLLKLALQVTQYNLTPKCPETGIEVSLAVRRSKHWRLPSPMQTYLWGLGHFSSSTWSVLIAIEGWTVDQGQRPKHQKHHQALEASGLCGRCHYSLYPSRCPSLRAWPALQGLRKSLCRCHRFSSYSFPSFPLTTCSLWNCQIIELFLVSIWKAWTPRDY